MGLDQFVQDHWETFILARGDWYLSKNGKSATNNIKNAKLYKTWQGANLRAKGTSWKFCQIGELLAE